MATRDDPAKRARITVLVDSRQAFIDKYLPFVEVVARVMGTADLPLHFRLNQPNAAIQLVQLAKEMIEVQYRGLTVFGRSLPTVTATLRLILLDLQLNEVTIEKRVTSSGEWDMRILKPVWLTTSPNHRTELSVQQIHILKKQAEDIIGGVYDRRLLAAEVLRETLPGDVIQHELTPFVSYNRQTIAQRRQSQTLTH